MMPNGESTATSSTPSSANKVSSCAIANSACGAPTVKVPVRAVGGWSRVVAVLSARTSSGKEIVVAGGGAPTRPGGRAVTIRLIDQATLIPKGSTLTLTLASSSLAQDPANLLYLDLPMPATARATFGAATLSLPVLARAISR